MDNTDNDNLSDDDTKLPTKKRRTDSDHSDQSIGNIADKKDLETSHLLQKKVRSQYSTVVT